MEDEKLYESSSSSMTILLQSQKLPCSSELVDSLLVHNQSSKPSFQGLDSGSNMVKVVNVGNMGVKSSSFFQAFEKEENNDDVDDENYEVCLHQPGKKRRLTNQQVHFLESNFEIENKLEPERKVQLAKELGLQQRQVAIWFQNRRARFKTKQLEKDYGSLKASYDMLKVDYDNLLQENNKLKEEVNSLKKRLVPREEEENNLVDKSLDDIISQHKSDVVDSECLQNTDGNQSSIVEPNQSEFSQDEEDILSQNLLTVPFIPKIEDVIGCYDEPHESCCSFQFPFEDQTFCFWSY